jgi:hypothetical protein
MSLNPTHTNLHTPIYLEIVLESYYFGTLLLESESRKKFYAQAKVDGLVEEEKVSGKAKLKTDEVSVQLTERGRKFVDMLLNTPLPVVQTRFVDPRFEEVDNAVQKS